MDPKAMAKSKRSHTQFHSKKSHHPNQKPKAPSPATVASGNLSKPPGKQSGGRTQQSKGGAASLPSNWDRYEVEGSIPEDPSLVDRSPAAADVVLPKSKGADYGHLISEAQAQSRSDAYLEPFSSIGDVFPDFNQGVRSILSSRGQNILSRIEDYNFIVDDRAAPNPEAPFLSLNLNTLAEQLAQVNLSERLFIEPDLLPFELSTEASGASSGHDSEQGKTCSSEAASASDFSRKDDTTDQIATASSQLLPMPFLESSDNGGLEPKEQFAEKSVADTEKKPYVFEGSAAEAELDLLLDSFNETKFLDSVGSVKNQADGSGVTGKTPEAATSSAAIDELLEDSANLMVGQRGASPDVRSSASSAPSGKPKVLDDFDSWLDTI